MRKNQEYFRNLTKSRPKNRRSFTKRTGLKLFKQFRNYRTTKKNMRDQNFPYSKDE